MCGLIPCPTDTFGSVFLVGVYCFLVYTGGRFISSSSTVLTQFLPPSTLGSLALPVLFTVPDVAVQLTGFTGGTAVNARASMEINSAALLGVATLLVTLTWGVCIYLGRTDLSDGPVDPPVADTPPVISPGAVAMKSHAIDVDESALSPAPGGTPEPPKEPPAPTRQRRVTRQASWLFVNKEGVRLRAPGRVYQALLFAGLALVVAIDAASYAGDGTKANLPMTIICVLFFIAFMLFESLQPVPGYIFTHARRLQALKVVVKEYITNHSVDLAGLADADGNIDEPAISRMYDVLLSAEPEDAPSHSVSAEAVRNMLVMLSGSVAFRPPNIQADVAKWVSVAVDASERRQGKKTRKSDDVWAARVDRTAFGLTMRQWVAARCGTLQAPTRQPSIVRDRERGITAQASFIRAPKEGQTEEAAMRTAQMRALLKCAVQVAAGIALCALFINPLTNTIVNLEVVTGIPMFIASYLLIPLTTTLPQVMSCWQAASGKTDRLNSITLCQIYGSVFNLLTLSLAVFLAALAYWGLPWVYHAEAITLFLVLPVMGYFAFQSVHYVWQAYAAVALYAVVSAVYFVLDQVLHV